MLTAIEYKSKLNELLMLKNKVVLDPDPTKTGLALFNQKIADLEDCRERVASLMLEATWNKAEYEQRYDEEKAKFDALVDAELLKDEIVAMKSDKLRSAKVNQVLATELTSIREVEARLKFSEAYYKNVETIQSILKSKNDSLFKQIDQVKAMMGLDPALRDELKSNYIKVVNKNV